MKSCGEYQSLYNTSSGYYYVDPDGTGSGESSFEVYCDMSRAPPLTVLENNAAGGYTSLEVAHKGGRFSLELDVGYRVDLTDEQLDGLLQTSSEWNVLV